MATIATGIIKDNRNHKILVHKPGGRFFWSCGSSGHGHAGHSNFKKITRLLGYDKTKSCLHSLYFYTLKIIPLLIPVNLAICLVDNPFSLIILKYLSLSSI